MTYRDRARGCLLGLAAGDALGAPAENLTPAQIAARWGRLTEITGGGTDDTEYALFAASLLVRHGHALTSADVAQAYRTLVLPSLEGPMKGAGFSELGTVEALRRGLEPPLTGAVHLHGWSDGLAMRAAPYGVFCPGDPAEAARLAEEDGRVSHAGEGILGGRAVAAGVAVAMTGAPPAAVAAAALAAIPADSWTARNLVRVCDLLGVDLPSEPPAQSGRSTVSSPSQAGRSAVSSPSPAGHSAASSSSASCLPASDAAPSPNPVAAVPPTLVSPPPSPSASPAAGGPAPAGAGAAGGGTAEPGATGTAGDARLVEALHDAVVVRHYPWTDLAPEAVALAFAAYLAGDGDVERAVTFGVSLGRDADTIGAIAGALAGAGQGEGGVPARWAERIGPVAGKSLRVVAGRHVLGVADELASAAEAAGAS
ncbi:ADP-ribosylglycohydrolase family protein [Thermoactinospora rubra]|uniref:ADP-ribosylglycohydrolase family protein n=1 Tax=Thermoactinospora rubra TaxID=1088767 RepID=UPI00197ED2C2|nr:ADP-ribosylglycohydrolase family protein [Thermoactinospora rubra]